MNKCPNCQSVILNAEAKFCDQCGYTFQNITLTSPQNEKTSPVSEDDDLEFVVTEAHEESPELVGGIKLSSSDKDDELGLQSTADLMENEARSTIPDMKTDLNPNLDQSPIGESAPPPPPVSDYDNNHVPEPEHLNGYDYHTQGNNTVNEAPPSHEPSTYPQEEPVAKESTYLSDQEKQDLISKIENVNQPFGNTPIIPPRKAAKKITPDLPEVTDTDLPKPVMAKRSRGLALYYRNFIQLKGDQQLHENDEMSINDRLYVLKEKKLNPKVMIGIAVPIFILILVLIGAQFIRDTSSGQGRLIGMAFDEYDQPYLQQAVIRLPELNKVYKTNPQGFFQTELLPAGTYKVEYVIEGNVVGVASTTIFNDDITTLMLEPQKEYLTTEKTTPSQNQDGQISNISKEPVRPVTPPPGTKTASSGNQPSVSSSAPASSRTSKYAKITLAANVDGARLKLDGSVIGAGNLTYSKLKPGTYTYTVSKDGYQSATGSVNLVAGNTTVLEVALKPLTTAQKKETYNETDYYNSAQAAYKDGQYQTAINDLTKAIELKNSYAEAYHTRAEVYLKTGQKNAAHDDFVRAAEIYQFRKDINQAITAYNKAVENDPKSITARLGRAYLYLNKGEEIAAIADYESVIQLDKHNTQAYFGLGEARFKQGYYKKAIKHFKDARSLDPGNPQIYQFLMLSYLGDNDLKNVKKSYEKFKELATEEQMNQFNTDKKYSAVLRVIEAN